MNLVGVSSLKTTYAFDEGTGEVTITFTNLAETTTYGTITVEISKHRALMEMLATVAKRYSLDSDDSAQGHRLVLDLNDHVATTSFA